MNPETFNRLHSIRLANEEAQFAMEEMRPRFDRLAGRHENGTAPRAVSAFNLFQTPPALAARMAALLPAGRILEPSAGLGRLLDAIPAGGERVAVEIDTGLCAELYRQDRPATVIKQRDFLTVTRGEIGEFKGIIMNPPFHMRADIRHILHARQFLAAGGLLVALCMAGHHRETALRPLAASWETIPAGTFRQTGTNVETVLLTVRG